MKDIEFRLNRLADFPKATETGKRNIIVEHLMMQNSEFLSTWYSFVRHPINKHIILNDVGVLISKKDELYAKTGTNNRQKTDIKISIEALDCALSLQIPDLIKENDFEIFTTKEKSIHLYGLNIKVSPNVLFRTVIDGQKVIGGAKVHISKSGAFNIEQSRIVSHVLYQFLSDKVAGEDELVMPELSFCVDPFSKTIVNSAGYASSVMKRIKDVCLDIPNYYKLGQMRFQELEERKKSA